MQIDFFFFHETIMKVKSLLLFLKRFIFSARIEFFIYSFKYKKTLHLSASKIYCIDV